MQRTTALVSVLSTLAVAGCLADAERSDTLHRDQLEATSYVDGHGNVSSELYDHAAAMVVMTVHYDEAAGVRATWIADIGASTDDASAPASLDTANRSILAIYEASRRIAGSLDEVALAAAGNVEAAGLAQAGDGCDPGDWGNECMRACCDAHDQCYRDCGCTGPGWLCRLKNPLSLCLAGCDVDVAVCLGDCVIDVVTDLDADTSVSGAQ